MVVLGTSNKKDLQFYSQKKLYLPNIQALPWVRAICGISVWIILFTLLLFLFSNGDSELTPSAVLCVCVCVYLFDRLSGGRRLE